MEASDADLVEAWFGPESVEQIAARFHLSTTYTLHHRWHELRGRGLLPAAKRPKGVARRAFLRREVSSRGAPRDRLLEKLREGS